MAHRNNLLNRNVHNGHDLDPSPDGVEQNPTINGLRYIFIVLITFPEQPTPLAQQVTDQRTTNPQDLTNQQINRYIVYEPDNLEATIPAISWFTLLFFGLVFYLCWPLFLILFIGYLFITSNNQPEMNLHETQLLYSRMALHHTFEPNTDAQAEGRTAQATEEGIRFSNTIGILDSMPYGIHPDADIMIDNENDNTNDDEVMVPNVENEPNVPITANEDDVPQTVIDDLTCNINPVGSIESRDDFHPNDTSDGEDTIMNYESGFDGDDEDDSADDSEQTGRVSPIIQNNSSSNQINTDDEQPIAIALLRNEAVEIEANVDIPGDGTRQAIISRIRSTTGILIPKLTDSVRPIDELSDEPLSEGQCIVL